MTATIDGPSVSQRAASSSGDECGWWLEHTFLAEEMGVALAHASDLSVGNGTLWRHLERSTTRVDVLYVRMDEDMLLSSIGNDGHALRPGLLEALAAGTLTIANALGNGVADDKAVYPHVPAMIKYYLGEELLLPQLRTRVCAQRHERDHVLAHLGDLVVKPIDGLGGTGVLIGPEASERAIEQRRRELLTQPERFVAQEMVDLSTHPTFDGEGM